MKKANVQIGQTYRVKVSGSVVDVRITGENPHGGWDGVNVATNRKVRIKSAQRLRAVATERPTKRKKIMSLAEYEAEAEASAPAANVGPTGDKSAKATKDAKGEPARPTGERDVKEAKRPSGLDAAAQILAEAGEPLSTGEMVKRMLDKGLWATGGKTPAATIYSAILREINVKGDQSRFHKTERGRFELAK